MENEIKDGGSAFPEPSGAQCGGMTLRDYFAAKALPQVMSSTEAALRGATLKDGVTMDDVRKGASVEIYKWADAMLAAREKAPQQ